jgi:hypothetical protein
MAWGMNRFPDTPSVPPSPPHVTEDVQRFIAFRFFGKAPMVGYRVQAIFYLLWLDCSFTLYEHS